MKDRQRQTETDTQTARRTRLTDRQSLLGRQKDLTWGALRPQALHRGSRVERATTTGAPQRRQSFGNLLAICWQPFGNLLAIVWHKVCQQCAKGLPVNLLAHVWRTLCQKIATRLPKDCQRIASQSFGTGAPRRIMQRWTETHRKTETDRDRHVDRDRQTDRDRRRQTGRQRHTRRKADRQRDRQAGTETNRQTD